MRNQKKKRKKNIVFLILATFFIFTFRMNSIARTVTLLSDTTKIETTKETENTQTPTPSETITSAENPENTSNSETITPAKNPENKNATDNLIKDQKTAPEVTGNTSGDSAIITASSGISYSLNFSAYDPDYYSIVYPSTFEGGGKKPPEGREIGANYIPGADSSHLRESLEPRLLALGQIVPYEVEITVTGDTSDTPAGTTISFTGLWNAQATNGDKFGFDRVLTAFVDYGDGNNSDYGNNASAKILSSGTTPDGKDIKGTFEVSGLNGGDKIIVEIWVVLQSKLPSSIGGNIQASLDKKESDKNIQMGRQTVPLNSPGNFISQTADVQIIKSDSPDRLYVGDILTYTITVTNNSNDTVASGIVVTDTLDPNVTFLSASDGGVLSGNVITWDNPLNPLALEPKPLQPNPDIRYQKVFTVTVRVKPDAPTDIYKGTEPDTGSASDVRFTDADITNIVKFNMITKDSNEANNVWQEPTNVLPRVSVTAYKVWVGGPSADHKPVELTLYRQVGTVPKEELKGISPTITPESSPADKFTYTWNGLPMYNSSFQQYVYTVDEVTEPATYTKTIAGNTITNTYKPSLVVIKVFGKAPLQGAIFELYAGNNSEPTGTALKKIITGSDGKAAFSNLEDGNYWLIETKPPIGYRPIDDIGPFTVKNGAITGPAGFTTSADGETGNFIITVQNEPVGSLPATGGPGTISFLISGLVVMIFALYVIRRKKVN